MCVQAVNGNFTWEDTGFPIPEWEIMARTLNEWDRIDQGKWDLDREKEKEKQREEKEKRERRERRE
jgi:hypothetical protein